MCPDLSGRVTVRLLLRTTQLLKGHHAGDPPGGQGAAGDVRAVPGRNTQERSCAISTPTRLPLSSLPPLTPSSPPSDGRIADRGEMTRHGQSAPPPSPGAATSSPRRPQRHFPPPWSPRPWATGSLRRQLHQLSRRQRQLPKPPFKPEEDLARERSPRHEQQQQHRTRPAPQEGGQKGGSRLLLRSSRPQDPQASNPISSTVDVSSSDKLHILSRSEFTLAQRVLPLSSTTAHARQAQIKLDCAAQDSADIVAVIRAHMTLTSARSSVSIPRHAFQRRRR